MPRPPRPGWGRPVAEYFSQDPSSIPFPVTARSMSNDYVKTVTIPALNNSMSIPPDICTLFFEVLSLIKRPKELRSLDNTMLLSRCMLTLHGYTDDSDPQALFDYELGYLCIRVISLLLHVGILTHTNTLGAFWRRTGGSTNPFEISVVMRDFVMNLMHKSKGQPKPRDWLLGTLTSQRGGRMFLRTVGGFINNDVDFLLNVLWQDRKTFLHISTSRPTPGWGLVVLLIGEHVQWASETGVQSSNMEQWARLQNLCFRYSLVASSDELKYLESFCLMAGQYQPDPDEDKDDEYYETALADTEDARVFLQAYLNRMSSTLKLSVPAGPLPLGIALQLVGFFRQAIFLDMVDLMPSLIKTSCARIWERLEESIRTLPHPSQDKALNRYAIRTFDIIGRLYSQYTGAPTKTITLFTKALAESDFVNLLGRIVLLPLSHGSEISTLASAGDTKYFDEFNDSEDPDHGARDWARLARMAFFAATSYGTSGKSSNGVISHFYQDWLKIWRCFDAKFPQHDVKSTPIQGHMDACYLAVLALGSSFSYVDRKPVSGVECSYPRCPGAAIEDELQFVCPSCLLVPYCGRLCQNKHWDFPQGPHGEACANNSKPAVISEERNRSE